MGTVASLLAEHVSFRCTSVDRIGIRGYIPGLMYEGGLVKFLVERGNTIPSPAALNRNRQRLVSELDTLVARTGVPLVRFNAGQSKEDTARPYQDQAAAAGTFGLVLVGKAQERTSSWRGYVDESYPGHRSSHPHIVWRRQSSVPDHWYFYFADPAWGPTSLRLCSYAPYPLWVNANGHEWAKAQLARAGIGFEELDNGLRAVDDPAAAHRVCARLGAGHVRDLLARMMAAVPDPLTVDDRRAGFDWAFSIAQMEIWRALRRLGADTNARFLTALGEDQPGLPDPATLESVVLPSVHNGQRAPGLRFGDPRTMALLASISAFSHVLGGLTNKALRSHMAILYQPAYTSTQATYDLRRLRLKGFIARVEHTNTYRATPHGLRIAAFFTQLAARVVIPTMTDLAALGRPRPPAAPRPLTAAWRNYEHELAHLLQTSPLAA